MKSSIFLRIAGLTFLLTDLSRADVVEVAAVIPPAIFFVDVESGPVAGGPNDLGVPISIFGKGFGALRGSGQVSIGGVEVASYLVWGSNNAHNPALDMIVVQPGPKVTGGAIVVTVNGRQSNTDFSFSANRGKIYYVSALGSDANVCSLQAPCATILHVTTEVMQPGDVALVRAGTSSEREVWIRNEQSGRPGQPKVVKNYPGEEVFLVNSASDILVDASYITVSGLNFRNGKALLVAGWASSRESGNKFLNNTFAGTIGYAAIEVNGDDHLVAGNVCSLSGSNQGTQGHCYYISQGQNVRILYNTAGGAGGYGLHVYDEQRSTADFQRVIRNLLVQGNVLQHSPERAGMIIAMSPGSYSNYIDGVTVINNVFMGNKTFGLLVQGTTRNVRVYNNTFYQNGGSGIYVDADPRITGVDVSNNLIYQSAYANCTVNCIPSDSVHIRVGAGAQNVTVSNNSYHPGSPLLAGCRDGGAVTGPIRFANEVGGDFHLLAGSSDIDTGSSLDAAPADFDGRKRPQGNRYDIGAFEYQSRLPVINSVMHAASLLPGAVSPGSIVTIFGSNLGPEAPLGPVQQNGLLARTVGGSTVFFGETPSPLLLVQANQVNALVPFQVAGMSSVTLQVDVAGVRSNGALLNVVPAAPVLFTADYSGKGQAVIVNEDGTLNAPATPAPRGSIITFYAAGLGQTDPPGVDGAFVDGILLRPVVPVSVLIDGIEVTPIFAGTANGMVAGLFQVNLQIPQNATTGSLVPLVLKAGDAASQSGVTVAIR